MNVFVTRHGHYIPEYQGEDASITNEGALQMAQLADAVKEFVTFPLMVLESPSKRTQESTDNFLQALEHEDVTRKTLNSLGFEADGSGINEALSDIDGDVLIMTHSPVIETVVENLLKSKTQVCAFKQGSCLHLRRIPKAHPRDCDQYMLFNTIKS